jgi:hypothetical protein
LEESSLPDRRQWSKAATTRTTPALLALFSLICLMAYRLHAIQLLSPCTTAWYAKTELTFSDLLQIVRASLWQSRLVPRPVLNPTPTLLLDAEHKQLIQLLASSF